MGRFIFYIIVIGVLVLVDIYLFQVFKYQFPARPLLSRRNFAIAWFSFSFLLIALFYLNGYFPLQVRLYVSSMVMIFIFTKIIIFIPLLLADLAGAITGWIHPSGSGFGYLPERRKLLATAGIVLASVPFISMFYGLLKTAHDFKVHRVKLVFPNLPAAFSGLKIVQVSDIHTGSWSRPSMMDDAVRKIMELKPDLILFTGDMVNNRTDEAFPFEEYFTQLKAPMGIFAILGNHDYGDYIPWPNPEEKMENFDNLLGLYDRLGWKLLRNESVALENESASIGLIGVENWSKNSRFRTEGRLDLAHPAVKDTPFKILMSHDPSHWDAEVRQSYKDIDLTLSGHTHGFQFGVEIPGIKWSPSKWLYKQWAGLYQEENQYIYVNRGLGCLGFSGRVGIRPEITAIELYQQAYS